MREAKFKIWVPSEKVMTISRTLSQWCDAACQYEYDTRSQKSFDEYVWLQFTGMLDRDGKEVYEGDILQGRYAVDGLTTVHILGVVEFEAPSFGVRHLGWWWDFERTRKWEPSHFEIGKRLNNWKKDFTENVVIGNIYQNPELLDG